MTYLIKDVADHLKGSTNIVNEFSDRIWPDTIPQEHSNPYPCIIINDVSNVPEQYLGGEVGSHESIIQIDVWTDGKEDRPRERINELGELIRNRLNGYRGQLGTGVFANNCERIRSDITAADPTDGSSTHRRRASQDYRIRHTASVPSLT